MESRYALRFLGTLIFGILISFGLITAGLLIGKGFYQARAADRYITVKGIAEVPVKADLGVWEIDFREVGNNLIEINTKLEQNRQQIIQFLQKQGFAAKEISSKPTKVTDQLANTYGTSTTPPQNRYILTGGVLVQTANVDLIQKVNQSIGQLVAQGIALAFDASDLSPNPSFFYTKLDSIRPSMLAKATQSARLVAQQFAQNVKSNLGGIRRASQGQFQVSAKNAPDSGDNSLTQLSTIDKKVRLVTTIDYFLKK